MNRWRDLRPGLGSDEPVDAHVPVEPGTEAAQRGPMVLDAKVFGAIGTNAWKAKARLSKMDTSGNADLGRIERHLDAMLESLQALGLEIKDHTGEPFDYGQSLKVAASQPKAGITREFVSETIRPSIYLRGRLLQQGEVVIDVPAARKE
jgi:hypothetical protein